MISIDVSIDDNASGMLKGLIRGLSGEALEELNEVGGRGGVNAAKQFHKTFDEHGGWRGSDSTGSGASGFGANIVAGWFFKASDRSGAIISNNADHFGFKVRGGTIVPKRVNWLTIPLIAEARGRRVRDYEIAFERRLFRPKGKNVLMEKVGKGEVRSVYALLKQVTQQPWPDALPPDSVLAEGFVEAFQGGLEDWIETL